MVVSNKLTIFVKSLFIMVFTAEQIEYINSVCERFNIAFKTPDFGGITANYPEAGQNQICLKLGYWERPTDTQGEFLSKYFIHHLDDIFDEDCGWLTSIIVTGLTNH